MLSLCITKWNGVLSHGQHLYYCLQVVILSWLYGKPLILYHFLSIETFCDSMTLHEIAEIFCTVFLSKTQCGQGRVCGPKEKIVGRGLFLFLLSALHVAFFWQDPQSSSVSGRFLAADFPGEDSSHLQLFSARGIACVAG